MTAIVLISVIGLTGASSAQEAVTEQQVKDFTSKLEALHKKSGAIDATLIAALRPLNTLLDQIDAPNVSPVTDAAKALSVALSKFKPGDSALAEKAVRDALDSARQLIEDTEKESELLRIEARAKRLSTALTAFKEQTKPPLTETLAALKSTVSNKLDTSYGIHIVYARVGDLRFVSDKARTCNAVGYFRQECQKSLSCKIKDGVTLDQICGYDPSPFAEDKDRGAAVGYRCVTATSEEWQHLVASDWDFHNPKSASRFALTGESKDIHEVRLQGKAIFYCDRKPDPNVSPDPPAVPAPGPRPK